MDEPCRKDRAWMEYERFGRGRGTWTLFKFEVLDGRIPGVRPERSSWSGAGSLTMLRRQQDHYGGDEVQTGQWDDIEHLYQYALPATRYVTPSALAYGDARCERQRTGMVWAQFARPCQRGPLA